MNEDDVARLARELAAAFLAAGNYTFSPNAASSAAGIAPVTGAELHDFVDDAGFAGLAVQAVGYEDGAAGPRIRVYVVYVRSIDRDLARLEREGWEGYPVVIKRTGLPRPLTGTRH